MMKTIKAVEPELFRKHQSTLKDTSYNDAGTEHMTDSSLPVIDFDAVKSEYIRPYHCSPVPKSNDALLHYGDEYLFIEFKDGNMKNEIHGVRRKIFESLLLFCDITDTTISFSRKHVSYMLVYNQERSKQYIQKILSADEVQDSPAIGSLIRALGKEAKKNVDYFGLRRQFKDIYFKEVYSCERSEFPYWQERLWGDAESSGLK
ncbi:MAG: hypothetical protein SPL71_02185 [Oribacterium sp.]|nr:hypothetical protein [Oribacterium sp.]